jgi:hypothetical protein
VTPGIVSFGCFDGQLPSRVALTVSGDAQRLSLSAITASADALYRGDVALDGATTIDAELFFTGGR